MNLFIARSLPALALLELCVGCSPQQPAAKPASVIMSAPPAAGAATVARESLANTIDPICDMALEEKVQHTAKHDGKTYGFCSDYCAKEFAKDPKTFLTKLNATQKK